MRLPLLKELRNLQHFPPGSFYRWVWENFVRALINFQSLAQFISAPLFWFSDDVSPHEKVRLQRAAGCTKNTRFICVS
jgi:hypothetical protein